MSNMKIVFKGGPGSGHHGHAGRPGKVGGSSPGEGGSGGGDGGGLSSIDEKLKTAGFSTHKYHDGTVTYNKKGVRGRSVTVYPFKDKKGKEKFMLSYYSENAWAGGGPIAPTIEGSLSAIDSALAIVPEFLETNINLPKFFAKHDMEYIPNRGR